MKRSIKPLILFKKYALIVLTFLLVASNIHSQLSLAKIFSNNMVLQCDVTVPIWGKASPDEGVKVNIGKKEFLGQSDDEGKWRIEIPAHKAGTKVSITVSAGENQITLDNIIFGDVWLCGGQSNMEWYVEGADNPEEEISNAEYPNIRLYDVPRRIETSPAGDFVSGEWAVCSPSSVPQFSAIGYYFGRTLLENTGRPIGLLSDNYGGTIAETWTSEEGLSKVEFFDETISDFKQSNLEEIKSRGDVAFNGWLSKFKSEDAGMNNSKRIESLVSQFRTSVLLPLCF